MPPGTKVICPTAPVRQITLEADDKNYYAWFDILGDKDAPEPEPKTYHNAAEVAKDKESFSTIMKKSFNQDHIQEVVDRITEIV